MSVAADSVPRESIGELFGRATAEGKAYATAQVEVVKQTALDKVDQAKVGVGLLVAGGFLAYAVLIAFLVSLVLWLDELVGPLLAGLIVLVAGMAVSFILIKVGLGKLSAMGKANGKLR